MQAAGLKQAKVEKPIDTTIGYKLKKINPLRVPVSLSEFSRVCIFHAMVCRRGWVSIHVYIYIYIYIYIHTHIYYMYIYIYICTYMLFSLEPQTANP